MRERGEEGRGEREGDAPLPFRTAAARHKRTRKLSETGQESTSSIIRSKSIRVQLAINAETILTLTLSIFDPSCIVRYYTIMLCEYLQYSVLSFLFSCHNILLCIACEVYIDASFFSISFI